jgi:hypothetical protein
MKRYMKFDDYLPGGLLHLEVIALRLRDNGAYRNRSRVQSYEMKRF